MTLEELTGSPPDPDCLHCYLAPFVDEWRKAHPHIASSQVIAQLAQVLGDIIGSGAWNSSVPDCTDRIAAGAYKITRETAADMIRSLRQRTTKQ